jgi:hypothetical protein
MSLVILEGLDRTGKSTVAAYFESLGFEVVHMSATPKGTTHDQYLQELTELVSSAAHKDLVLDRSHFGEMVWPFIYGRKPILTEEDFEILSEIEQSVGTRYILMHDTDSAAHWKRCVDNNEPLNKSQFVQARGLYSEMADKYGFERITLQQFIKQYPDAEQFNVAKTAAVSSPSEGTSGSPSEVKATPTPFQTRGPQKTKEQLKLEKANAINEVLSKRILKQKNDIFDELEYDIRIFLNERLGKLLGGGKDTQNEPSFSKEEIQFYKAMYARALKGE